METDATKKSHFLLLTKSAIRLYIIKQKYKFFRYTNGMNFLGFFFTTLIGVAIFLSGLAVWPTPSAETPETFIPLATSTLPLPAKEVATTPIPAPKTPVPKKAAMAAKKVIDLVIPPPPPPEPIPEEILNTQARAATVNILCRVKEAGGEQIATGSGIFIDARGVVLTNAHVAAYLLYPPEKASCHVRTGEPARFAFPAQLLYFSPSWARDNQGFLLDADPKGTGAYDFALLMPQIPSNTVYSFATTSVKTDFIVAQSTVFLSAYPAGFLGSQIVQKELYPSTAYGSVGTVYTFSTSTKASERTPDLVSLGSPVLAQKGSSGGGVFDQITGELLGLIVTTTKGETTGDRTLHGTLVGHIERIIKKETGGTITSYLQGDLREKARIFDETLRDELLAILTAQAVNASQ